MRTLLIVSTALVIGYLACLTAPKAYDRTVVMMVASVVAGFVVRAALAR
jgi:hypothetical protein